MVPEQIVSVDVQIFYKKYGFNIFSHTYGCLIKNFVTERFVSLRFLVSCNSPRVCCERKIIPPSHSRPFMAFLQLLPPDCAMEELAP